MQPRQLAARLEASRSIDGGAADSFAGYGLAGLVFETGHVIGFRRATASTIGPPFSALWLRSPAGRWTIYTNVDPARACPRYLAAGAYDTRMDDIEVRWTGPRDVVVTARAARLQLALRIRPTAATVLLGAVARLLPDALLAHAAVTRRLADLAARLLGAGRITLSGRTPTGHAWRVRPRAIWCVEAAAAVLAGRELGATVPLREPVSTGSATLPTRGIFAAAEVLLVRDAVTAAVARDASPSRDEVLRRILMRGGTATDSVAASSAAPHPRA